MDNDFIKCPYCGNDWFYQGQPPGEHIVRCTKCGVMHNKDTGKVIEMERIDIQRRKASVQFIAWMI